MSAIWLIAGFIRCNGGRVFVYQGLCTKEKQRNTGLCKSCADYRLLRLNILHGEKACVHVVETETEPGGCIERQSLSMHPLTS